MRVYIKGTKDELFEDGCPCRNSEYGYCQITRRECQYGYECPLIEEVPDHGDDLISRKAAIKALQNHYEAGNPFVGRNTTINECVDVLHELPSAQGWTPVIEGLPVNHGQVWCTYADGTMGLCHFDAQEKTFISGFEVVAWMPKPAPYQGEAKEAKE